jgi:uncharacterized protein YPO0396
MNGTLTGQYRIEEVQVLNWGGYGGLQVMRAGRTSTAILGPSGRGKSTLLDAIASVIMPNPQEFNQAARDDRGRKHERTVYSYVRGQTVNRRDGNQRSSTTAYLRPPGSPGFPSGTAITWADEHGNRVTAFRLAWVGPDATGNDAVGSATTYGFVHDRFGLAALDGIKPVRAGSSPLSKASLERFVDLDRGDVVDPQQSRVHAKMRHVMSMGATEESQRLAMHLLRRAQASKGIFSINALFKEFVLTVPQALDRWQTTLAHYEEASRLYDEFEFARHKLETLSGLHERADRYRAAGQDWSAKSALLRAQAGPLAPRLKVWHAGKVLGWAGTGIEDNRLEEAGTQELLQSARRRCTDADQAYDLVLQAITDAGGDRAKPLRLELGYTEKDLREVTECRDDFAARLKDFQQVLPVSAGDLTLLRESIAVQLKEMEEHAAGLAGNYEDLVGQRYDIARRLADLKDEAGKLAQHRTNVPPHAAERRDRIAQGTGLAPGSLRYVGELLEIRPEYRGWEKAIVTVLLPLARTLAVDEADFARVRAYVNNHHMRGDITLIRARSQRGSVSPIPGTVPAMLDITDGPQAGWLSSQLRTRFSYLCVERDTDLDIRLPDGVTGAVTRAGMRATSRDQVTKHDTEIRYRWIGQDNQQLRHDLAEEGRALAGEADGVHRRAESAREQVRQHNGRIAELSRLADEITWEKIDTGPLEQRIAALSSELAGVDTPENRRRRDGLTAAQDDQRAAHNQLDALQSRLGEIGRRWAELCSIEDEMNHILETNPVLTEDERAATAQLPFRSPADPAGVQDSYHDAAGILQDQVSRHASDRRNLEDAVLATIRAYRNIDERTAREIDDTIESLPALIATLDQLTVDDLPRARRQWLGKIDADLNQALRTVLTQIEADGREIRRGLDPINQVLSGIPFRQGSCLALEPVEQPNSDLREFRDIVTTYTRAIPLGEDLFNDTGAVEASFTRLRKSLSRLSERSRAGDTWRKSVFDAREHVEFRAIESRPDGTEIIHDGVAGMSGGEGQELIAFILGAALRYRLGEGGGSLPAYGSVILDEGFVKADSDFTGRALRALQALGFQLIVGAPREKATAFEDHVDLVAYINADPANPEGVRIYSMTIQEALKLDNDPA